MRLMAAIAVMLAGSALGAGPAWAWGHTGHHQVSLLATQALPAELPEELRSPEAAALVAELGPEPDLSKGAGNPHDADRDPGHYVDLDEAGRVFGVLPLAELPPSRDAYDTRLRTGGVTQYRAGFLPYELLGGWQQVRHDLAWWRAARAGVRLAPTDADRAWFERLARHRLALALHDIGVWSHYVADASQPLHVSVHFNGWGDHPNPRGFSQDRRLHARFEGEFVRRTVAWPAVAAAMPAYQRCDCTPAERLRDYLGATLAQVVPLYALEQRGAFQGDGTADGRAFVTARLAAGASALRDLLVDAWRDSATDKVGWPAVSLAELEAGQHPMRAGMFWQD